ncbi:hypothetical protein EGY05_01180 [Chryseobacterium arthrosphaerae]|nr:hypothetical protein EGY05_01180 [Chryseobacterium arthrosphaerae]
MQQKKDITNNRSKRYTRILILILFFSTFLFSCKGQDKEKRVSKEIPNLIGQEFIIDQINPKEDKFSSKNLDQLFNKKSYTYLIGEYSGTSRENFNCKIVGLFKNNVYEKSYALFFDSNNFLKDTLNITKKDISLDVKFENNKKGIALGNFDISDMKNTYFKITDLYEIDNKTITLKKININQKILKCEIPIDYISEEYEGLESYFHYGITDKPDKKEETKTYPSDLKGMWGVICQNELTVLKINKNEGFLSLYDFNAIYINLKVEKLSKNEYLLKYASVSSQEDYYKENLKIIDEDISKEKVIGKLILQKNGKAELQWFGLYNTKKQKLEFVGNDFLLIKENGGKTPLILEQCH